VGGLFCSCCLCEVSPKDVTGYGICLSPEVAAEVPEQATEEERPVVFSICLGCHPGVGWGDDYATDQDLSLDAPIDGMGEVSEGCHPDDRETE